VKDKSTHGVMFAPVILNSDKTTVSVAIGQNNYYPLYISLGNVQVSLVAFLSIPKGKYILIKYLFLPSNPFM
jgi:Plavaka transposase